jgi:hypothetical protein
LICAIVSRSFTANLTTPHRLEDNSKPPLMTTFLTTF